MLSTRSSLSLLLAALALLSSGCAWLAPGPPRTATTSAPTAPATRALPMYTEPPMSGQECHDLARQRGGWDERAIRRCMGLAAVEGAVPPQAASMGSSPPAEEPLPPRVYRN